MQLFLAYGPNLINEKYVNIDTLKELKLKFITTAGGPHNYELVNKLKKVFGDTKIYIMYGLTESFRSTYLDPDQLLNKIGSIGKPVKGVRIKIINKNGEECAPGEKINTYRLIC